MSVTDSHPNTSILSQFEAPWRRLDLRPSSPGVLEQLFQRLSRLPRFVYLDSSINTQSSEGHSLGRYSFLAAEPIEWYELQTDCPKPFAPLREAVARYTASRLPELPPFQGGLAGLFSYDLNRSLEPIQPPENDPFQLPLIAMGLYDVVIAIDHVEDTIHLVSQGWPETDPDKRQDQARRRLQYFMEIATTNRANGEPATSPTLTNVPRQKPDRAFPLAGHPGLFSNFSQTDYLSAVKKCIDYIYCGDVFQVNLAQQLLAPATLSASELYLKMRSVNPAPFSAYFDLGTTQIISASPERFLQVREGVAETRPIKGTRPRTRYPEVDINMAQQLRESEKDRSENVMIVDLMRNDLSRVCQPDSVQVSQCCELETYQSVLHLVSAVRGRLRPQCDLFDLLKATFPGGSITGAPKVRAMQIIQELEPTARGAYCGSLGYIGTDGSMDLNILIRTITAHGGWWQIPVGGGIVSQSDPEEEYRETWTKAASMLKAVGL